MKIQCISCGRTTAVEKRETAERLARRRWMVVEDASGACAIVCGGNDKGAVRRTERTLRKDLFPDGKGGLVELPVAPGFDEKEVDICLGKYLDDFKTTSHMCHLFIPDLGSPPPELGAGTK